MKKTLLLVAITLVLVFAFSGVALAATPQDIYDDYAADGTLDGSYTEAELEAYLGDAAIQQYGDPAIVEALNGVVRQLLAAPTTTTTVTGGTTTTTVAEGGRTTYPFTGFELLATAAGALALVGSGLGLRSFRRRK